MTDTTRRRRHRFGWFFPNFHPVLRAIIALLLILALTALGIFVGYKVTHCAPEIKKVGDQCIGITDGTDGPVFGAAAATALKLIGEENSRLPADPSGREIVSVAYVIPLPPPGKEDDYANRLSGDIMGVAVAQRQANRTNKFGDRPLIRVLVVNVGDSADPSLEPIDQLIAMTKTGFAEHRLMAVAVSGKSLEPLTGAIDMLVNAKVPVIISHLTAEQVTSAPVTPNSSLARVAPTTSDEAAAAAAYLKPSSSRALIVQNSDQEDRYAQSLGMAFRERYSDSGHTVVQPEETYIGGQDGAVNAMPSIVRNICQQRPDAVFFAGRAPELRALVAALPARPCLDLPVRLITGDDGASFAAAVAGGAPDLRSGLQANASFAYTSLAHPEAWRKSPGAFALGSADPLTGDCPDCFPTLFPGRSLDDSYAILAYDAVMTAVAAIRPREGTVSSPAAVINRFKRLHGIDGAVAGASGWISLSPTGSTIEKAVPIIGVAPDGKAQFLELSSPSGTPCTPGKTPC
jgi:ABC-type branched-subunit amino acid transport system substrate-binding protein